MANLDEILIAHAKHLDKLSEFMAAVGDELSKKQAKEIAGILAKNANNMRRLAQKAQG